MNIIIVGCGKVGVSILSSLVAEGHDVTAVDSNAEVIEELTNVYDVMGVCGNGVDYETLEEAQVEQAELFVASTKSDELNMLSCFLAKKMGAKQTIARIRNPEYNDSSLSFVRQQLDLSMSINPELLAAQELSDLLKLPAAVKIETFSRRNFEMIELRIKEGSMLNGVKLKDLSKKFQAKVLICVVQRKEQVYIPDGNFQLQSGDRIGVTASPEEIEKFLWTLGILQKRARKIMILGGSKTAYYLAKLLTNMGNTVKIIEEKEERCLELCDALPKGAAAGGRHPGTGCLCGLDRYRRGEHPHLHLRLLPECAHRHLQGQSGRDGSHCGEPRAGHDRVPQENGCQCFGAVRPSTGELQGEQCGNPL